MSDAKLRETMDRLRQLRANATSGPWATFEGESDDLSPRVGIGTLAYSDLSIEDVEARIAEPTSGAGFDFEFIVELVNAFDEIDAAVGEMLAGGKS